MRRGISQVLAATLLVLVSIAVVSIFYTWATSSAAKVSGAIYTSATAAEQRILASVDIIPPPPTNLWDTNQAAIIHNNGTVPLVNVRVLVAKPNSTTPFAPSAVLVENNGTTVDINSQQWPLDVFNPGEALVVWLPDDNYSGYTIMVIAKNFERSVVVGVAQ